MTTARNVVAAALILLPALLVGCLGDALCDGRYGPCDTVFQSVLVATSFSSPWDRAAAEAALEGMGYALVPPPVGADNETFDGDDLNGEHFSGERTIRVLVPQSHIENGTSKWGYIVTFDSPSKKPVPQSIAQERYTAMRAETRATFDRELESFEAATGWKHLPGIEQRPQFSRTA